MTGSSVSVTVSGTVGNAASQAFNFATIERPTIIGALMRYVIRGDK
jgi:hypothetical protein